jgi:branched-chain amino acid transport system ATP-binding protein
MRRERVLEVKDVHAGYGNLKILRGVNLTVKTGGIVTLLGGNGTGKSTLLKAVSGLIPLMEGTVFFDGVDISNLKPHERMRLGLVQVTQAKEAYPAMTVEENLVLGAYTRRDREGTKADLERVYEFFPVLRERRKQMSGTLSGGEVQMLVIGRGLMASPKMLMLDEPSAALAPKVVAGDFCQYQPHRQIWCDHACGRAECPYGADPGAIWLYHSRWRDHDGRRGRSSDQ